MALMIDLATVPPLRSAARKTVRKKKRGCSGPFGFRLRTSGMTNKN